MALICQTDSRIANASRSWEQNCDIDVTNWDKTNEFILASYALDDTPHAGTEAGFKMQWRRAAGSFADVEADTEIRWALAAETVLVDGTEPCGALAGCQTPHISHENEGDNACAPSKVNPGLYLEIQWGLGFGSGAQYEQEYEFQLFNTSDLGTQVCSCSITTSAAPVGWSHNFMGVNNANINKILEIAKANIVSVAGKT